MSPTKPQHQPKPATCEACSSKQAVQLIQASKGFSNHVCGRVPKGVTHEELQVSQSACNVQAPSTADLIAEARQGTVLTRQTSSSSAFTGPCEFCAPLTRAVSYEDGPMVSR